MPIDKQRVLDQWNSDANRAWIIIQNTKTERTIIKPGAGEAGDNPDARWKVHMSINIEQMDKAIPLIIDELNKEDSPNLSLKFASKTLLSKVSQAAKEAAFIIPPEMLTEKTLPTLQTLFQNIANTLNANGISLDKREINSDQIQHPTKWDKPLFYDGRIPSYFNYRDGQIVVLDDEIYPDMAPANTNIFREKSSKQCLVRQSYFQSLPESKRHNPENAHDPLSHLTLANPQRSRVSEEKNADEHKEPHYDIAPRPNIVETLTEEDEIFKKYNADQMNPADLLQRLHKAMENDQISPMYQTALHVWQEAEKLSHTIPKDDLKKWHQWKMSVVLAINVLETPKIREVWKNKPPTFEHGGHSTKQRQNVPNPEYLKAVRLLKANAEQHAIGKSNGWKKFIGALAMLTGIAMIGLSIAGIPFTGGASFAGLYIAGSLFSIGGAAFFYHNKQKSLAKKTADLAEEANRQLVF